MLTDSYRWHSQEASPVPKDPNNNSWSHQQNTVSETCSQSSRLAPCLQKAPVPLRPVGQVVYRWQGSKLTDGLGLGWLSMGRLLNLAESSSSSEEDSNLVQLTLPALGRREQTQRVTWQSGTILPSPEADLPDHTALEGSVPEPRLSFLPACLACPFFPQDRPFLSTTVLCTSFSFPSAPRRILLRPDLPRWGLVFIDKWHCSPPCHKCGKLTSSIQQNNNTDIHLLNGYQVPSTSLSAWTWCVLVHLLFTATTVRGEEMGTGPWPPAAL